MPLTPEQEAEIAALRETARPTLRPTADGMEQHLHLVHVTSVDGGSRVLEHTFEHNNPLNSATTSRSASGEPAFPRSAPPASRP